MEKFGVSNFLVTFALAITKHAFAEIAQLVERNLAKVEVAGPSPVFRSRKWLIISRLPTIFLFLLCVTDVSRVTQNTLKSPFVIQSVIHKIV